MVFKNRTEAGKLLAKALEKYKDKNVIVYALPRGGVVLGAKVAKRLKATFDLVIPRKIGHPSEPEFAIAATAENGQIIENKEETRNISRSWLEEEAKKEQEEAKRRRWLYLQNKEPVRAEDKTAIIVDDGVATGLTMRAAILEVKQKKPKKVVVAVPVIPKETAQIIKPEVDELISLYTPEEFAGAVGAYYESFPQITDDEVIKIMQSLK
ncbi:phosphoribosyl transferase [Candidatus Microgenomates bacterium]|nr:MAG: phosphoribosyl transferase [Candidatus Microgenomates bacterium]